jgi:WD40 repeat protein
MARRIVRTLALAIALATARAVVASDPIVVPACHLVVIEKQEVPSQRDGILLFMGTEVQPGETVPSERMIVLPDRPADKKYRRLQEGDRVAPGQLLALVDDRLARDDYAIKKGQILLNEANLAAAERARDDARDRYQTQLKLQSSPGGPATSDEDVATAKLAWYKHYYEAVSRKEAIALSRLELHQAETVLSTYEIRSTIAGVIKRIHKNPGEAVKALEPVLEVRNLQRLRVEGLVEVQHLPRLRPSLKVRIEPAQAQSPVQSFAGHLQEVNAVAVSKDPSRPLIVSGSEDGTVRVWERSSRREVQVLKHPAAVRAVACTPPGAAGNWCLSGAADGIARLWDLDHPAAGPTRELKEEHKGAIIAVAFSPDGKTCATGGEDRAICLWNVATGTLRYRLPPGHLGALTGLEFASPGRLISVGRDNALRVWAVGNTGVVLETTFDHRFGAITRLGVSADGRRVLFDQGAALHVLSVADGHTESVLQLASGGMNFASFALFSPDARLILTTASSEGRLQLWRTPTDQGRLCEWRQLVPPGHAAATCAAFAPDGSFLVSGTQDRQVLLWALPSKEEIARQYTAELTLVEPSVESAARQVRITAELANPDGRLIPGTLATLIIEPAD